MKKLSYGLILLFFILFVFQTKAQIQIPDILVYKGDTLSMISTPLENYRETNQYLDNILEKNGNRTSECFRGYVSYWEIINDSLFLTAIKRGKTGEINLSSLFDNATSNIRQFVEWSNDSILISQGQPYFADGWSFMMFYESEKEFIFKNGILTEINAYNNSKTKISKYAHDRNTISQYLSGHIKYPDQSNIPAGSLKVFVQIDNVNDDGIIDSVQIIKGCGYKEFDAEAERVVKSIPEWDVLYRKGQRYNMKYTVPIYFTIYSN